MRSKGQRQHLILTIIGDAIGRVPKRKRVFGILLTVFLGVLIASCFGGARTGVFIYHTLTLSALAWLAYDYAKSTDAGSRATSAASHLRTTPPPEDPFCTADEALQQRIVLRELLEELRKAEETRRPAFDLSAWERHGVRLETMVRLTEAEKREIASCYRHLAKGNDEVQHWRDLERELEGLVDCVKRRSTYLTLTTMEQENLGMIRPVISIVEMHLKRWNELEAKVMHTPPRMAARGMAHR